MKLRRSSPPPIAALTAPARRMLGWPLALGCAALAAVLCVPTTQYMSLQAMPKKKTATAFGSGDLPVEVSALESHGRVPDSADPAQTDAMTRRIAANIMLRSGYLANAIVTTDSMTGRPNYQAAVRGEISACAETYVGPTDSGAEAAAASAPLVASSSAQAPAAFDAIQAGQLAVAVVAVEKFNRNAVQRRAEWLYANALLGATGRLPDLSLGPAQIRPSAVRRLGAAPTARTELRRLAGDERALGEALADECSALGLAAALLQALACTDCDEAERQAVSAYAGQRRRTNAASDYTAVVMAILGILGS